ncbi:hypothetical protein [Actinomadura litoris]|uniref:hypothetical protein n=1 Tax=Actinomadura litoris TaxID=2678616 RepID=UPI001FA6EC88|nr:hypothetical protein [Actinomadura litoris]
MKPDNAPDRPGNGAPDRDGGDGGADDKDTSPDQDPGARDDDAPDDAFDTDDDTHDDDGDEDGKEGEDKDRRRGVERGGRRDDKSARIIAALRNDFKDERTKRQQAQKAQAAMQKQLDDMQATQTKQMDALAKALGLKKDDTPPSPEQAAKDFGAKLQTAQADTESERKRADTAEASLRDTTIQLAVYLAADDHDADPRALLDSARFLKTVAGLDPSDKGFEDELGQAITEAVDNNDRFRKPKPRAADRSGGEMNTGARRQRKRPTSLNEAVTKHYSQGN